MAQDGGALLKSAYEKLLDGFADGKDLQKVDFADAGNLVPPELETESPIMDLAAMTLVYHILALGDAKSRGSTWAGIADGSLKDARTRYVGLMKGATGCVNDFAAAGFAGTAHDKNGVSDVQVRISSGTGASKVYWDGDGD